MFVPQTTFGPHVLRTGDGTYVIVFRVNLLVNTTICAGDSSVPQPNIAASPSIRDDEITSGDPELGTSIYIAWAASPNGPWQVVKTNITGAGELHKSNPSIATLSTPLPTGEVYAMAYRYNPRGGSKNAIAVAHSYLGPWRNTANVTAGPGGAEDPYFFSYDGQGLIGHMLFHDGPHGYHAFGPVDGSIEWSLSPTASFAYTLDVEMATGEVMHLARRERPELTFRVDGSPSLLTTGVVGPDGAAFSFMQAIA